MSGVRSQVSGAPVLDPSDFFSQSIDNLTFRSCPLSPAASRGKSSLDKGRGKFTIIRPCQLRFVHSRKSISGWGSGRSVLTASMTCGPSTRRLRCTTSCDCRSCEELGLRSHVRTLEYPRGTRTPVTASSRGPCEPSTPRGECSSVLRSGCRYKEDWAELLETRWRRCSRWNGRWAGLFQEESGFEWQPKLGRICRCFW